MIQKNWPFNACTDCISLKDVVEFFNQESELLDIYEEEVIEAGEFE